MSERKKRSAVRASAAMTHNMTSDGSGRPLKIHSGTPDTSASASVMTGAVNSSPMPQLT